MSWCFVRRALFSLGEKRCAGRPTLQLKSLSSGPRDQYDVVIAGGGIMGCSSAYFLAQRIPGSSICVIERDPKVGCLISNIISKHSLSLAKIVEGLVQMSYQFCLQIPTRHEK